MDPLFQSMSVSASGMTAERFRMSLIANNLANVDTTNTPGGGPFQRQEAIVAERSSDVWAAAPTGAVDEPLLQGDSSGAGVEVVGVRTDTTQGGKTYDPGNPLADSHGYVQQPNVSSISEMVDLMGAAQHYRANVTAIEDAKSMATAAIGIGKIA
ncbi:MAG TPA: flagellar basal body rod protein FlgC [bacterium]|nr:flagellar basal body rod protein FlgC [bacterium]